MPPKDHSTKICVDETDATEDSSLAWFVADSIYTVTTSPFFWAYSTFSNEHVQNAVWIMAQLLLEVAMTLVLAGVSALLSIWFILEEYFSSSISQDSSLQTVPVNVVPTSPSRPKCFPPLCKRPAKDNVKGDFQMPEMN